MEKKMTNLILALLLSGAALFACSNSKEAEPEKGKEW